MRGLISCVGNPYPLFAMATQSHLSTQPCLISKKEKLNSGGVALSLLDYTANHFFQMRIGMSNDLLLPLDEVISPYIFILLHRQFFRCADAIRYAVVQSQHLHNPIQVHPCGHGAIQHQSNHLLGYNKPLHVHDVSIQ